MHECLCVSIYLHASEPLREYIYLNLLMWLCAYLCLCVCAHTPLVCLSASVAVCALVVVLEWNTDILPPS